jgi:hypothetical protein
VKRAPRPVLITDAEQSPAEELRHRQIRYIVMMLIRAGCLVLAAVLTMLRVPMLAVWVVLCLVGAVLLPWLAVILANDRAPKPEYRLGARRRRAARRDAGPRALGPAREPTVIDPEP